MNLEQFASRGLKAQKAVDEVIARETEKLSQRPENPESGVSGTRVPSRAGTAPVAPTQEIPGAEGDKLSEPIASSRPGAFYDISILIRQCGRPDADAKIFRAYQLMPPHRERKPLGIQSSTTGNEVYAVRNCAAKSFRVLVPEERRNEIDKIAERVAILRTAKGQWTCVLNKV